MTPTRPVLRYMGGKWRLAPWILRHLPPHRTYVEPFGGAASVLLRKPRAYAEIYNDLDGEIVSLFRVLRDPEAAAELVRRIALTPFAREEFDGNYIVHSLSSRFAFLSAFSICLRTLVAASPFPLGR